MGDYLAELFEQFNPEEQAQIKEAEESTKEILARGDAAARDRQRAAGSHDVPDWVRQPQDDAQADAAGVVFSSYFQVLWGKTDITHAESIPSFLVQIERLIDPLLTRYGWEAKEFLEVLHKRYRLTAQMAPGFVKSAQGVASTVDSTADSQQRRNDDAKAEASRTGIEKTGGTQSVRARSSVIAVHKPTLLGFSSSWGEYRRTLADGNAVIKRKRCKSDPVAVERLLQDARAWAKAKLPELASAAQDVFELKDRVVSQAWEKFVPNPSDFSYVDFEEALWEEGWRSLEDRAIEAICDRAVPPQNRSNSGENAMGLHSLGRPEIVLQEWGLIPDGSPNNLHSGQAGFHLFNDGIAAHEISVESFEIGSSMRARSVTLPRIGEKERGFLLVWLDGYSPYDATGEKWNLASAMAKAAGQDERVMVWNADYTIKIRVTYRDSRNIWYRSAADLIYVQSQMRLTFGSTMIDRVEPEAETSNRPNPPGKQNGERLADTEPARVQNPAPEQVVTGKYASVQIDSAVSYLKTLPGFYVADSKMRELSEPVLREIEKATSFPRSQAIAWLDAHAGSYLSLVTDQSAWNAYQVLVQDVWYPQAYEYLFGLVELVPLGPAGLALASELDARRRHWHKRASEALARPQGVDDRVLPETAPRSGNGKYCSRTPEGGHGLPVEVSPASAQHIPASVGGEAPGRLLNPTEATVKLQPMASRRDYVPSSTRAIVMHGFGSSKVAHIKVPKMAYAFPTVFPHIARRSFLAKRFSAERVLEERKTSIGDFQAAEALLLDFVLLLLVAFADEAYSVGMQGKLSAADMESECLTFLRSYVLEAGLKDSSFGRASDYTPIPDSLQARIESSDHWGKYRELLQGLADVQADELFIWATINGDFPEAAAAQVDGVDQVREDPGVPQAKAADQATEPQTENNPSEPQADGARSGGRINRDGEDEKIRPMFGGLNADGIARFRSEIVNDVYQCAFSEFAPGCDEAFTSELPPGKPASHQGVRAAAIRLSKRLAGLAENYCEKFIAGIDEWVDKESDPGSTAVWRGAVLQVWTKRLWGDVDEIWATWLNHIGEMTVGAVFGARPYPRGHPDLEILQAHRKRMASTLWNIAAQHSIPNEEVRELLSAGEVSREPCILPSVKPETVESVRESADLASLDGDFRKNAAEHALKGASVTAAPDPENSSRQPLKASRPRGRRPNSGRRDSIRNAITSHGESWRDHLSEIFAELDSHEVDVGDFQSMEIDLGDGQRKRAVSWEDLELAANGQRRKLIDALRQYVK